MRYRLFTSTADQMIEMVPLGSSKSAESVRLAEKTEHSTGSENLYDWQKKMQWIN